MMKVAVPQLGDAVAPRFEAARNFMVMTIDGNQIKSIQNVECAGPEGYRRVRMIQIHSIGTLICNGIKGAYKDMLIASGVAVISGVSAGAVEAVDLFISGRLAPTLPDDNSTAESCAMSHSQLVERAREIFEQSGYTVSPGPGQDSFLVDLVAEIKCPACSRTVRVAVCCGAHTYRADLEIREFHQASSSNYNARVYVSPAHSSVIECCREYSLELIDPNLVDTLTRVSTPGRIPLLRGPVTGHEKASGPVYE
ncbi:MAG: hypothetical protein GY841_01265 [FCB group bacterium]|nr:hypothetical protein [FCB group bacterium]